MNTHDVPDSFVHDETVVDFAGGAADDQAAQVGLTTSHGRSGVPEVHDEDVLRGFHSSTDRAYPAGFADLRSRLYDVELLPAHFSLNPEDASIVEAQSEPWDPGRVTNTARQDIHRHAPSNLVALTSDATQREAHQYSSSGYGFDGCLAAQHAHSFNNDAPYWNDLSMNRESLEGSYNGHMVESAPISSHPPSLWSVSDRIQQYLSPTTQSSQHRTQAGGARGQGATPTSTTRSVRSVQRRSSGLKKPFGSTASQGLGSSTVEVSAGPSNNSSAAKLHICFPCNKTFSSRSGLKRHRQTHNQARMNAHRCPTCQKGFRYPKDVERHLTTHGKTKKHSCPIEGCSKTFTRKDNAKRHSETHSTDS